MRLALAKSAKFSRECFCNLGHTSLYFEYTGVPFVVTHFVNARPFRYHWRSLLHTLPYSDSPHVMKIVPFFFQLEKDYPDVWASQEHYMPEVERHAKQFLREYFPDFFVDDNFIFAQIGDCHHTIQCLGPHIFQESVTQSNDVVTPVHYHSTLHVASDILCCPNLAFFQGSIDKSPLRAALNKVLAGKKGCIVQEQNMFYYFLSDQQSCRSSYERGMADAKYILCPRGWGQNSIRFYEAMAIGRIPVLIADDTRLAHSEVIPYNKFIIQVPESDIAHILDYLTLSDQELTERSALARYMYETHLSEAQFVNFLKEKTSET